MTTVRDRPPYSGSSGSTLLLPISTVCRGVGRHPFYELRCKCNFTAMSEDRSPSKLIAQRSAGHAHFGIAPGIVESPAGCATELATTDGELPNL